MSDKNISLSCISSCLLRAINFWRPPVSSWLPMLRKYTLVGSYSLPNISCVPKWTPHLSHPEKGAENGRLLWKARYTKSCKHVNQPCLRFSSLTPLDLRHPTLFSKMLPWDPAHTFSMSLGLVRSSHCCGRMQSCCTAWLQISHLVSTSPSSHHARWWAVPVMFLCFAKSGKQMV